MVNRLISKRAILANIHTKSESMGDVNYICESCKNPYPISWHASDYLWKLITGRKDHSGIFCIYCFDKMARKKNIILSWECSALSYRGTLIKGCLK